MATTYVVLQVLKKGMFSIRVVDGGVRLEEPFESWALCTGKQVLYTSTRMSQQFKQSYVGGRYGDPNGAMHIGNLRDAQLVLEDALGPTDRERYNRAVQSAGAHGRIGSDFRRAMATEVLLGVLRVGWAMFVATGKAVLFLIIFPIFLHLFRRHK